MSSKAKTRVSANSVEQLTQTTNERILKECHEIYSDKQIGLIAITELLKTDLGLLPPRKKIIVLLIGNHSSGKSSFINWYIEEHVQKTGVAIETQGFVLVTSGRKRESLTGNATFHLYPHFKPLQSVNGVVDYLSTEVSTSKEKHFSSIIFVDTPGLVDGDMHYPYDVNNAIEWFGDQADLIFVFFDPIGQALCKRTLNLVETLSETHAERMKFYLSKSDEAGTETDRQKVMMQIVQELCKRRGLNRAGFDMPTIYIPNPNKPTRCVNQIDDACREIERVINHTVQSTLNNLEDHCKVIIKLVNKRIAKDDDDHAGNMKALGKGALCFCLSLIVPVLFLLSIMVVIIPSEFFHNIFGSGTDTLLNVLGNIDETLYMIVPKPYHGYMGYFFIVFTTLCYVLARYNWRRQPVLNRTDRKRIIEAKNYLENVVQVKRNSLYREYLHQSVTDEDL